MSDDPANIAEAPRAVLVSVATSRPWLPRLVDSKQVTYTTKILHLQRHHDADLQATDIDDGQQRLTPASCVTNRFKFRVAHSFYADNLSAKFGHRQSVVSIS